MVNNCIMHVSEYNLPFKDDIHINQAIRTGADVPTHIDPGRIQKGRATEHQSPYQARLQRSLELGELDSVIGTQNLGRIGRPSGDNANPVGNRHGNDVGEIVFTLYVVVAQF